MEHPESTQYDQPPQTATDALPLEEPAPRE